MIELRNIPSLQIPNLEVPVEDILKEVSTITEWANWVPPGFANNKEFWDRHRNYLHSAITTVNPDKKYSNVFESYSFEVDGQQYDYFKERKWFFTDVAEKKLPKTCEFLRRVSDQPIIAKVIKTPPFHQLGWHSHQNDVFLNYRMGEQAITHIPLITSKDVCHFVAKEVPSDRWYCDRAAMNSSPNFWEQSFEVGKVSILNGYYPHMMKNFSANERITILIYNDLDNNPTLINHLRSAVDRYDGPIIQ